MEPHFFQAISPGRPESPAGILTQMWELLMCSQRLGRQACPLGPGDSSELVSRDLMGPDRDLHCSQSSGSLKAEQPFLIPGSQRGLSVSWAIQGQLGGTC